MDPIALVVVNCLLLLVIGVVGWLLKRAISSNDEKIVEATKEIKEATKAVSQLQLLIVGDYYPRKEHREYEKRMDGILEQVRGNVHSLRNDYQTLLARVSVLEVTVQTIKDTKEG